MRTARRLGQVSLRCRPGTSSGVGKLVPRSRWALLIWLSSRATISRPLARRLPLHRTLLELRILRSSGGVCSLLPKLGRS